jgi:hypothetical protein
VPVFVFWAPGAVLVWVTVTIPFGPVVVLMIVVNAGVLDVEGVVCTTCEDEEDGEDEVVVDDDEVVVLELEGVVDMGVLEELDIGVDELDIETGVELDIEVEDVDSEEEAMEVGLLLAMELDD